MNATLKNGRVMTATQVANVIGCSARTASHLIDGGEIEGWRIGNNANGGDRRVAVESLRRYLIRKGIPIPRDIFPQIPNRLLAVTPDAELARQLLTPGLVVSHSPDPFFAAVELFGMTFDAILLDALGGRSECLGLARHVRARGLHSKLVGLLTEDDGDDETWMDSGVLDTIQRPVIADGVAAVIKDVLSEEKSYAESGAEGDAGV